MKSTSEALKIISIQHELCMHIGTNLELDDMLQTFMERVQKRLSLLSVHVVWNFNGQVLDELHSKTFPHSDRFIAQDLRAKLLDFYSNSHAVKHCIEDENTHNYFLKIPDFGVLICSRLQREIEAEILNSLTFLMPKLATSSLACMQYQSLLREIEERKRMEQKLVTQSLIDPLTSLVNKNQFNVKLEHAIAYAIENKEYGAIFYIDLDRFKAINDSLGHSLGDNILREISDRLKNCFSAEFTIARIGGDEFAVIAHDLGDEISSAHEQAKAMAECLSQTVSQPIVIDGNELVITISTGINLFPLTSCQIDNLNKHAQMLIKNADLAMYRVKHGFRNGYSFFSDDLLASSDRHAKIEKALKNAILNDEFEVHYQPLVSQIGSILGAEALIRWNNPDLGWVSPAEFIPIAEETCSILSIGNWVIEQACEVLSVLMRNDEAHKPKYISVNISPRQFVHPQFTETLLKMLDKYKVPTSMLRIEVTENVGIDDMNSTIDIMRRLNSKGISVMLDDFGSGYSSLSYLHQLPLQTIKIDRSFISNIHESKDNQVITNAIIDICEHFSMECIVEGLEEKAELAFFENKTVTAFQGYHFYKPMPRDLFQALFV